MRPVCTAIALSLAAVLIVVVESATLSHGWRQAQTLGTLIAVALGVVLLVQVRRTSNPGSRRLPG